MRSQLIWMLVDVTILFEHLEEHGGQCWLTGTDQTYFEAFAERAQRLHVVNGAIAD